jgi:hypothetical protein
MKQNPKMELIVLGCKDFKNIWKYINESAVYAIPTAQSCNTKPNYLLSKALHLNFGYGEQISGGATTQHPGIMYTKESILQKKSDIVVLAPIGLVDTSKPADDVLRQLRGRRAFMVDKLEVKHDDPIPMKWAKRDSLHKIALIAMGGSVANATKCGYPPPGPKAKKKKGEEEEEEEEEEDKPAADAVALLADDVEEMDLLEGAGVEPVGEFFNGENNE